MCKMLEVIPYNERILTSKNRIDIDLINQGKEFIEQFEINQELIIETISIIYKYLEKVRKIPQNLFKFFIAAYYISSRHPKTFPHPESKDTFCRKFHIKKSSLKYSVNKIISELNYIKIVDDLGRPYFLNPERDIAYKLLKSVVKNKVELAMMNFLVYHQPINSQILSEDLVSKTIFEMKLFPEELFRQFYDLTFEMIEDHLQDYYSYIDLQNKYFI